MIYLAGEWVKLRGRSGCGARRSAGSGEGCMAGGGGGGARLARKGCVAGRGCGSGEGVVRPGVGRLRRHLCFIPGVRNVRWTGNLFNKI